FFSRVVHVDPLGLRKLLVITSDFHLPRTQAVFNWMYRLEPRSLAYELEFEAVSDASMPTHLLVDRQRKEQKSLDAFGQTGSRITTLRDCHRWLLARHDAYSAAGGRLAKIQADTSSLESY